MPSASLPDGVLAASLTPLTDADAPDGPALATHVQHLLRTGCDAVLLFGTTGEGLSFSVAERRAALEAVLDADVPPARLLVNTGALPLPDAVELTAHAAEQGVGGVLVPPPFHLPRPSDAGLVEVYIRLVEGVGTNDLQLYFYHYPQLTGVPIPFPVIETLRARFPEVIAGIKDSSGEWDHLESLCSSFPDLQVFSGTERLLVPALEAGGAGCISATVNLTAPIAQATLRAWHTGDDAEAAQSALTDRRTALSPFPTIPALKQMMAWRTDRSTWRRVRPPLVPLDAEARDRLRPVYEETQATNEAWADRYPAS